MLRSETRVAAGRVTRDISYAPSAPTRRARAVIRIVETMTGRRALIARARGYEADLAEGRDLWRVLPDRFGLSLDVTRGSLEDIPATGPLILVANHPFGLLDGLMMGHILASLRRDFRLLAHSVFGRARELEHVILPVAFEATAEARATNLATRRAALDHLAQGGAIGIFPGGTVSTAARPFARPADPVWRPFTARMIARSGATVVPLYFDGQTSRLFQVASHLNTTLRLALLVREFRRSLGCRVPVAIGAPLSAERLAPLAGDPAALMDFLRRTTYDLAPTPGRATAYGYEFEAAYQKRARA